MAVEKITIPQWIAHLVLILLLGIMGWIAKYFIQDIYDELEKQEIKIDSKVGKDELRSLRYELRRNHN